MKNITIGKFEITDLQKQVSKILKGLGNPSPPLNLDEVRELLRLDRQYYSCSDGKILRDVVSKVKIAGKQLFNRPTLLFDVVRKAQLSALWIPDKKRILIDESKPRLKHRWNEAHEIGHCITPWHGHFLFGDDDQTLNPAYCEKLESEANYVAGNLLFLQNRFPEEARTYPINIKTIKLLADKYGNTKTSTLWRFVEEAYPDKPILGIVSKNPNSINGLNACKYCIESPLFKKMFSGITEQELIRQIQRYCSLRKGGPLGESEIILKDDNGEDHLFLFESFSNTHEVLTVCDYIKRI